MSVYYANKDTESTIERKVHKENCYTMTDLENRLYPGYFSNVNNAVRKNEKISKKSRLMQLLLK